MKTVQWPVLAVLVCVLAACSGLTTPDPEGVLIDEKFPAWVHDFVISDSTAVGGDIIVHLAGEAGSDGSYRLERIDQDLLADGWHLTPIAHHYVERGMAYTQAIVQWNRTLLLTPPRAGWVRVHVTARQGGLVDSTYVFE